MAINPYMNVKDPGYYQSLSFEDISRVAEAKTTQHVQQDQLLNTLYAKDPVTDDDKAKYLEATQGYNTAVDQAVSDLANKGVSRGTFAQIMSLRDKNRTLYDPNYGQLTGYVNKYKVQQDTLAEMAKMKGWSEDPEGLAMARKYILGQTPAALDENGIPRQVAYDLPPEYIDVSNYIDERLKNTGEIAQVLGQEGQIVRDPATGAFTVVNRQGQLIANSENLVAAINGLYTELLDPESPLGKFVKFRHGGMDENTFVQIINQRAAARENVINTPPQVGLRAPRGSSQNADTNGASPKADPTASPVIMVAAPGESFNTASSEDIKATITTGNTDKAVQDKNLSGLMAYEAASKIDQEKVVLETRQSNKTMIAGVADGKTHPFAVLAVDMVGSRGATAHGTVTPSLIEASKVEAQALAADPTFNGTFMEVKNKKVSSPEEAIKNLGEGYFGAFTSERPGRYVKFDTLNGQEVRFVYKDPTTNQLAVSPPMASGFELSPTKNAAIESVSNNPVKFGSTRLSIDAAGLSNAGFKDFASLSQFFGSSANLSNFVGVTDLLGKAVEFENVDKKEDPNTFNEAAQRLLSNMSVEAAYINDFNGIKPPTITIVGQDSNGVTRQFEYKLDISTQKGMDTPITALLGYYKSAAIKAAEVATTEEERSKAMNALNNLENIEQGFEKIPNTQMTGYDMPITTNSVRYNTFDSEQKNAEATKTGIQILTNNVSGNAYSNVYVLPDVQQEGAPQDPNKIGFREFGISIGFDPKTNSQQPLTKRHLKDFILNNPALMANRSIGPVVVDLLGIDLAPTQEEFTNALFELQQQFMKDGKPIEKITQDDVIKRAYSNSTNRLIETLNNVDSRYLNEPVRFNNPASASTLVYGLCNNIGLAQKQ